MRKWIDDSAELYLYVDENSLAQRALFLSNQECPNQRDLILSRNNNKGITVENRILGDFTDS
jgi:hypothetical protein